MPSPLLPQVMGKESGAAAAISLDAPLMAASSSYSPDSDGEEALYIAHRVMLLLLIKFWLRYLLSILLFSLLILLNPHD